MAAFLLLDMLMKHHPKPSRVVSGKRSMGGYILERIRTDMAQGKVYTNTMIKKNGTVDYI